MKKVILRLIVAAIAVALIVLILLNTVFKVPATEQAYNELSTALSSEGDITKLSNDLSNNEFSSFKDKYGDYLIVFDSEMQTLHSLYPKLMYMKGVEDESVSEVTEYLNKMKESLNRANIAIDECVKAQSEGTALDMEYYMEQIKNDIINCMDNTIALNSVLNDFILKHYFSQKYSEELFMQKIKTLYAKKYFSVAAKDYASAHNNELVQYDKVSKYKASILDNAVEMNEIMNISTSVNLDRIVNDLDKYKEENNENEQLSKDIEKVANFLDKITK